MVELVITTRDIDKSTHVLEGLTSSTACSKECRGGVAVDVVEEVCDLEGGGQLLVGA